MIQVSSPENIAFACVVGATTLTVGRGSHVEQTKNKLKIMIQGYWGSNEPTKAGFPFDHGIFWLMPGMKCRYF